MDRIVNEISLIIQNRIPNNKNEISWSGYLHPQTPSYFSFILFLILISVLEKNKIK
jgi:hypothetical protein